MKTLIRKTFNALGLELIKKRSGVRSFYPSQGSAPQVICEEDDQFHRDYERAQAKTQMADSDNPLRRQRHYILHQLLRNNVFDGGDYCELGCWRGLSAFQTAAHIETLQPRTQFHVFDSFEGLSDFAPKDRDPNRSRDESAVKKQFACSLETVQRHLSEFDFISFYKGWIPECFPKVSERTFCWVHVDVDLYLPVKESFLFFYPRLKPQGLMIFDDYGCLQFPGAKKAVDECLAQLDPKNRFFLPLVTGQALLIKFA